VVKWGVAEAQHGQMRICTGFFAFLEEVLHSLYGSLDETIGLWIVWTSCHVDETICAGELLE